MVKLTSEMKEDIKKLKTMPLATASKSGTPNVVPVAIVKIDDSDSKDDYIHIMNNFFLKTMANLKENPKAAIYIWSPETVGCIQMKGELVDIISKGAIHEGMKDFAVSVNPTLPMKETIRIKITEIFNCALGKEAGQRIV